MSDGVKFFKIKLIKKLLQQTIHDRNQLLQELINDATDPIIVKRRIRMIKHLNLYENQLLEKIQNFQTNDLNDLINFDPNATIKHIVHRSA